MRLDVHVEGLGLQMRVWGVVHTWDGLGRLQVMQVRCQLTELRAGCLFLSFLFFQSRRLLVVVELPAHFLVLKALRLLEQIDLPFVRRGGGNSSWRRSHARTSCCSSHGSYKTDIRKLAGRYGFVTYYF